jgi:hypothetical protein
MTATIDTQPEATAGRTRGSAKSKRPASPKAKPKPKPAGAGKAKAAPADREVTWPAAVKPSLVLLPTKVRGARARRKAIRGAIVMSVGILGATVVGYISVAAASSVAQAGLEAEMAKTADHQKVLDANKPVQDFYDGLALRREAAAAALAQDVNNTSVLKAVSDANTVGATFTSITKSSDPAACPAVDPFTPSLAIGCLQIAGTAPTMEAIGELSAGLSRNVEMLTSPYISESSMSEGTATFKLTVGYTDKAFSNKGKAFETASVAEDNEPAPSTGIIQEPKK